MLSSHQDFPFKENAELNCREALRRWGQLKYVEPVLMTPTPGGMPVPGHNFVRLIAAPQNSAAVC